MVLQDNYLRENATEIAKNWRAHTIIKHEYLKDPIEKETFREGADTWGLICALRQINDSFKRIGAIKAPYFNYSILFDILTSVDTNTPFTMEQLEKYFKLLREIESFADKAMDVFNINLIEDLYVSSGADMIIAGISLQKYEELEKLDKQAGYHFRDDFYDLKWKVIKQEIGIKAYKDKAFKLLDKAFEEAKRGGSKKAT